MAYRHPSGILASCVLPWTSDLALDEELFRREIELTLAQTPLVYVMGTAGEGYAVSGEQFRKVVRVFVESTKARGAEPMVGVISLADQTVRARIEWARSLGVRQFQISLPSWGTCTPDEARAYFRGVCGEFKDCAFLHYNLARAGRILEPEEIGVISRENPNLVATKNGNPSVVFLSRLIEHAPEVRHFITDMGFPFASFLAECGLLIAMASCNWRAAKEFYERAMRREYAPVIEMQQELIRLNADILSLVAPHGHIDGAYDKMYVKLHIPEFPLRLLPPYSGVPDSAFDQFIEILRTRHPQWYPGSE